MKKTCMVRAAHPQGGMGAECGRPVVFLTAEQAQLLGRGPYSGWRHVAGDQTLDHGAVPKGWA